MENDSDITVMSAGALSDEALFDEVLSDDTQPDGVRHDSVPDAAPTFFLNAAAARLSQVRYVFVVQIEDGIPTVDQRAALEYSDAVLVGWPDSDDSSIDMPTDAQIGQMRRLGAGVEKVIEIFKKAEKTDKTDDMADSLVRITGYIASIRKIFQPDFLLPTYAEIRRVIEDEWNEEMSHVTAPEEDDDGRIRLHLDSDDGVERDDAEEYGVERDNSGVDSTSGANND